MPPCRNSGPHIRADHGDQIMISATSIPRAQLSWRCVPAIVLAILVGSSTAGEAQMVQGVQQGAQAGNRAAGPVGGVLGGAIGGVVGVFTGVLGVGNTGQAAPPAASSSTEAKEPSSAKTAKATKARKLTKQVVVTQAGEPQLTAEQIVTNSDANIDRIKTELNLTGAQEKNWTSFNGAMHYLGHNCA